MSDAKPFVYCRQYGEEVCIEADDGFVVARFALDVASQAEYTKDAINSAVEARERAAAAKALEEAAMVAENRELSIESTDHEQRVVAALINRFVGGIAAKIRSRAAAIRKGEA